MDCMRMIPALLTLAALSQPLFATADDGRANAPAATERSSLVRHLLGEVKNAPDADLRRERVDQELALQDRLLSEASRLGLVERSDVKAKIELARRRVIVDAYWEDFFRKNPITESSIKERYQELAKANGNQQYKLSQIFVKADAEAHKVFDLLSRKKNFADVAKDMSQDERTRPLGGDLGWRWKTEVIPDVARLLDYVKPGEYTRQPIITPAGVLIVRVDDQRKQDFPTLDRLRPELENTLRQQAQQIELARLQAQAQ